MCVAVLAKFTFVFLFGYYIVKQQKSDSDSRDVARDLCKKTSDEITFQTPSSVNTYRTPVFQKQGGALSRLEFTASSADRGRNGGGVR